MSSTTTAFQFDEKALATIQSVFDSPFKFRMMLLTRLPMGFLSGMRIHKLERGRCEVDIRYKWLNKNPFQSTFWAVLGMAAEMSSGALILLYTHGQKPSIATLVTATEARYHKKAVGRTRFICESGEAIAAAVAQTVATGQGVEVRCPMQGFNDQGELVAEFAFTWSLKARLKP
jgi:acyl-coenzyme A thioesterase PaaI-like protein